MASLTHHFPQFFTATILEWKRLLQPEKYKDLITRNLCFLVKDKRVAVYGFVIMSNHIHLVWQIQAGHERADVQRDFLKHTAMQMKEDLLRHHPQVLPFFKVKAKDRQYQFWERNPLSIDLYSHAVLLQKLAYIHQNPVRAGLCKFPEDYKYSSAWFYHSGTDNWGFLSHYSG